MFCSKIFINYKRIFVNFVNFTKFTNIREFLTLNFVNFLKLKYFTNKNLNIL